MSPTDRRLLIISYHFPPDGAIGGMRWAGISKYLARLGWEVHILTASASAGDTPVPGVHMHVHPRRRTLNSLYNLAKNRIRPAGMRKQVQAPRKNDPEARHEVSSLRRAAGALRRYAGAWLAFPDFGRGWMLRAAGAARALLRSHRFDLVLSSGPPHSAHIAGVLATLGRREPLWIDMRDPWTDAAVPPIFGGTARFLLPRLEALVRRRTRHAIVTTSEFAATLRLSEPWLPVSHVSNGVDLEQLPKSSRGPEGQCVISYAGTIYGGRNLTAVLAAMREIVRDQPELRKTLRLHFAGSIDESHTHALQADLAVENIAELVELHGVTSRATALELLNGSHLALVLAQDQHLMIPAKIYESMALGVPTLVIAEPSSAAARESKRIGAFTVGVNDVKGIRRVLEDILASRIPARVTPAAPISHEALAAQLDALFREGIKAT